MEGEPIIVKSVKEKDNYTRLVNQWNPISESCMPTREELIPFKSRCTDEWMYLEKRAYEAFMKLKQDAFVFGYDIDTDSTYRTFQEQESVMEEFIEQIGEEDAKKRVSSPGASEHHTALAIDLVFYRKNQLVSYDLINDNDLDYCWVISHLSDYGFILRYPRNSIAITGIIYEPWHIRYVGKEVAQYMKENNLFLEEYHDRKVKKKTHN